MTKPIEPAKLHVSFSIDTMRAAIETGIRHAKAGKPLPAEDAMREWSDIADVKRQTLRTRQPIAKARTNPYWRAFRAMREARGVVMTAWWKKRSPNRSILGNVQLSAIIPVDLIAGGGNAGLRVVRATGKAFGPHAGVRLILPPIGVFARRDGFDSVRKMREYFFPDGVGARGAKRRLWLLIW